MDKKFFSVLEDYWPLITKIAMKWEPTFMSNQIPITVDDIRQEMALAIFRWYGQYDRRKGRWATWIIHVCRSRAHDLLDEWKTQKRHIELIGEGEIHELLPCNKTRTPLEEIQYNEFYENICRSIGRITYKPPSFEMENDKTFAQLLFFELISPSPELVQQIRKKCKELDDFSLRKNGRKRNRRTVFRITNQDLAVYFGVKVSCVKTCVKLVRKTVKRCLSITRI